MKKTNKLIPAFLSLLLIVTYFVSHGIKSYVDEKEYAESVKETSANTAEVSPSETVPAEITPPDTSPAELNSSDITPNSNPERTYTLGWSVYDNRREYFARMQEGVLAKAKELNINVIIHNQMADSKEMVAGATNLINQGIDALVISPYNPDLMPIIVELANEADIPVVVVDVGSGGTEVVATILSDNFAGGVMAADYALKLIKEQSIESKNFAIIKVEETSTYARRRGDAFQLIMEDAGFQLIAEITANSNEDEAYRAMKEILEYYGDDLAVVFSENDLMAIGAARAIEEVGKKGEILVIGFDGIPKAISAIKNGLMQGTIAQQPFEMGTLGVEIANNVLKGVNIIFDDRIEKELYIEVNLIDKTGNVVK